MHDDLRSLIGNSAESFRAKGAELLAGGDLASAGAAFTCERWLRAFVPIDRSETATLPFERPKPAPADKPKRERKRRARDTEPPAAAEGAALESLNGEGAADVAS